MPEAEALLEHHQIALPGLPAALDGFRIAHLTDLHISRPSPRCYHIAEAARDLDVDLVALTGDYMSYPGDESPASDMLRMICEQLTPRCGIVAVYGNHDSIAFRRAGPPRGVTMLVDQPHRIAGLPLEIWGCDTRLDDAPDFLALMHRRAAMTPAPGDSPGDTHATTTGDCEPLRLALCHKHIHLPTLGDLGAHLVLSGHTHGGQCRLPGRQALVNSTDLPLHLTSGIVRHQDTLALVSRGLGQIKLNLRLFCPPHLPVYTLRQGPLPGEHCWTMRTVQRW